MAIVGKNSVVGTYKYVSVDDHSERVSRNENNSYHGEYTKKYSNGVLFIRSFYIDGNRHGEYRDYWDNGEVWEIRNYRHGKLHGECYEYSKDGTLGEATMYYNDVDLRIDPRGLSDRDKLYVMMSGTKNTKNG